MVGLRAPLRQGRRSVVVALAMALVLLAPVAWADRRDQRAADLYTEGVKLIRQGKYREGAARVNAALARGATEPVEAQGSETRFLARPYDPYYWLGVAQMETGLTEQALSNFEKSSTMVPKGRTQPVLADAPAEWTDLQRRKGLLLASLEVPTPVQVAAAPPPSPTPTPFALRLPERTVVPPAPDIPVVAAVPATGAGAGARTGRRAPPRVRTFPPRRSGGSPRRSGRGDPGRRLAPDVPGSARHGARPGPGCRGVRGEGASEGAVGRGRGAPAPCHPRGRPRGASGAPLRRGGPARKNGRAPRSERSAAGPAPGRRTRNALDPGRGVERRVRNRGPCGVRGVAGPAARGRIVAPVPLSGAPRAARAAQARPFARLSEGAILRIVTKSPVRPSGAS